MPLTILLVDDEKTVRSALGRLLSARSEWKIVGEANDGVEAVAKTRDLKPDVVIMDVTMPEMNGLEATPQIKKLNPATEVLIFTQHDSNQMIREAQKAGASGYLLKSQAHWLAPAGEDGSRHKPFFQSNDVTSQSDLNTASWLILREFSLARWNQATGTPAAKYRMPLIDPQREIHYFGRAFGTCASGASFL